MAHSPKRITRKDLRRPDQKSEDFLKEVLSENYWLKEELLGRLEEATQELKDSMINSEGMPEEKEQMSDTLEKRREMIKFLNSLKPKISK